METPKSLRRKVYLYTYKVQTGDFSVNHDIVINRQSYSTLDDADAHSDIAYAVSTNPTQRISIQVNPREGKVFAEPYQNTLFVWFNERDDQKAKSLIKDFGTDIFSLELKTLINRENVLRHILNDLDNLVKTEE